MRFSEGLARHYEVMWDRLAPAVGLPEWAFRTRAFLARVRDASARARYERVEAATRVPWWIVAVIHEMESTGSWTKCLHNGDQLPGPTWREPKRRGPFKDWEEAAIDALELKTKRLGLGWDVSAAGVDGVDPEDWTIEAALFFLERYNGWGYMLHHPAVASPYLWAGSGHYSAGKYASDGQFAPALVSAQVGAAVLLRVMLNAEMMLVPRERDPGVAGLDLRGAGEFEGARLQQMLNAFGALPRLKVDGAVGPLTREAMRRVWG